MARKTSQTRRKAPLDRVRADRGSDSPISLEIGPPPRFLYRPNWPEIEAQARAVWERCRELVMAESTAEPASSRPWAYFWFDRPPDETRPGPLCDALVAEGRLTETEAELMGSHHLTAAYGAISRAGSTLAEWIAAPKLAARTIALVGWNPFTPERIASLREREQQGAGRRRPFEPSEGDETDG